MAKPLMFHDALDQIIDMGHALMRLAQQIHWRSWRAGSCRFTSGGRGGGLSPTRLPRDPQMDALSDEVLRARWVENPYFLCGEPVFRHEAPFDRSSLMRRRQRMGEERLAALIQESLAVAHRTDRRH